MRQLAEAGAAAMVVPAMKMVAIKVFILGRAASEVPVARKALSRDPVVNVAASQLLVSVLARLRARIARLRSDRAADRDDVVCLSSRIDPVRPALQPKRRT